MLESLHLSESTHMTAKLVSVKVSHCLCVRTYRERGVHWRGLKGGIVLLKRPTLEDHRLAFSFGISIGLRS